jgi:hypothetical protein
LPQFLLGGLCDAWQQRRAICGHKSNWNLAKNVLTTGEKNTVFFVLFCHRPLGKHSLARGSTRANHRDFRGIMEQTKEEIITWELKKMYSIFFWV